MKIREPKSYVDLINEFNKVHGAKFKFYGNDSNPNFRVDNSSKLKRQHKEALDNINRKNLEERNKLNDQFDRERTNFNTNINNLTQQRDSYLANNTNLQRQFNELSASLNARLQQQQQQYIPLQNSYNDLSARYNNMLPQFREAIRLGRGFTNLGWFKSPSFDNL